MTGAAGISTGQGAGTQPNTAEIEKVRDNLFMIKGGGGNTAAFVTASGVVLVDTKLAKLGYHGPGPVGDRQARHHDH